MIPEKSLAISAVATTLATGHNPGSPIELDTVHNGLFQDPKWQKMNAPYGSYQVHYWLNEETCQYAELKARDTPAWLQ